ncbi:MAG: DUF1592 domain-containing protein [Verrucomicrobiota bacterium]
MKPALILSATLASATLFAVALTSCMSDVSRPPATAAPLPAKPDAMWADFQTTVRPFLAQNCYKCHGEKTHENDLRLDLFVDPATLAKNHTALEDALDRLTHQEMPPSTEARPAAAQQTKVIAWLEGYLASGQSGPRDPGRVTLRRLNRAEYNNTVRDLLGIDVHLADAFPVDLAGYGFDNNGDVLSIAPVLMEKYLASARLAIDAVLKAEPIRPPNKTTYDGSLTAVMEGTVPKSDPTKLAPLDLNTGGGTGAPLLGRWFLTAGEIYTDHEFPVDGTYEISVRAYGTRGAPPPPPPVTDTPPAAAGRRGGAGARGGRGAQGAVPQIVFLMDGERLNAPLDIAETQRNATVTTLEKFHATAGKHRITLAFLNGATAGENSVAAAAAKVQEAADTLATLLAAANPPPEPAADPALADAGPQRGARGGGLRGARGGRGARAGGDPAAVLPNSPAGKPTFGVAAIQVEGPFELSIDRMAENYGRLMVATPSPTVTREQAAEKIISNFVTRAFRRPGRPEEQAALLNFWRKSDADGRPFQDSISLALQAVLVSPSFLFRVEQEPQPGESDNIHTLTEYELASRLSYFIWSTMPDDELFALAAAGQLRANLPAQVARMIHDPRSSALVENFAGQWLQLRQMDNVNPDPARFPAFDEPLREAMTKETQLFFTEIMRENRSVLDFLDADFTYVNERLARHYGLEGVTGGEFRRVSVPKDARGGGGILTQASILTLTSYNNRTSPVLRGKWVLENLLDSAPPPPPPNVPALVKDEKAPLTGTMRELMEQHRTNPTCAACHSRMDPIGFGLENFDGIGSWRTTDAKNSLIDASGKLPDGRTFDGPAGLKEVLLSQKDRFVRTTVAKLLTFALGRGLERSDNPVVDEITAAVRQDGYKFSALVNQVVQSAPFQKRRGRIAPVSETAIPLAQNP